MTIEPRRLRPLAQDEAFRRLASVPVGRLAFNAGWSVVVTGFATLIDDSVQLDRYERLLHPWLAKELTEVIRIDVEIVTGYELVVG